MHRVNGQQLAANGLKAFGKMTNIGNGTSDSNNDQSRRLCGKTVPFKRNAQGFPFVNLTTFLRDIATLILLVFVTSQLLKDYIHTKIISILNMLLFSFFISSYIRKYTIWRLIKYASFTTYIETALSQSTTCHRHI